MADQKRQGDEQVITESRQKLEKPPLFKVLLHNDNFTTMEFVVFILVTVFQKSDSEAVRIMLKVHHEGVGIAGVYPYEIAEMKVAKVTQLAREREFPLLSSLEEE